MSDEKKKLDEDSLRAVRDWTNGKFARTSSICPVYNEEALYDAGDLVSHDGILYQCIEDETSGEWDETKWSDTSISVELANTKNDIDTLKIYRGLNFTLPLINMPGVKMEGTEVIVGSGKLPVNGTYALNADNKTYVINKVKEAVRYGYVIDNNDNPSGAILMLNYFEVNNGEIYVMFGGSGLTQTVGISYEIEITSNELHVYYGEV